MPETSAYVRKLYNQELGYRHGEPAMAGRYLFVSKKYTGYFPALSTVITNDFAIIKLVPPNSNNIVLAKYVYHNDKITEGKTRDEYRIYLNAVIDPDREYFQVDDIVVLYKNVVSEDDIQYKFYHFPASKNGKEYQKIKELLQKYSSGRSDGSHALIPISELEFIKPAELCVEGERIIPESIQDIALEEPCQLIPEDQMREEFIFTRHIREGSFRELVTFFYEYKCAVTETVINYKELYNLEAAHIIPDSHRGPSHPKNGLALNRDMHWAFDKGFFTISDDYKVVVHEKVMSVPILSAIQGKTLYLPRDERAKPSLISLDYHRRNIFGIFAQCVE